MATAFGPGKRMIKYERTNCANCGAALVNRRCPYCGTQWVPVGFQIGEHGIVKSSTLTMTAEPIDITPMGGAHRMCVQGPMECEVSLDIIGLTPDEAMRIWLAIRDAM